jgi:hypothetical protein
MLPLWSVLQRAQVDLAELPSALRSHRVGMALPSEGMEATLRDA